MSSRLLLNLGLLITVIVLGLYIFLAPPPAPPPSKPTLTSLKSDSVDHITIMHGEKSSTVLQKQDGHWRLTQPVDMPANDYQANKLAHLADTVSQSQYPIETDKLAVMGLVKPKLAVKLNDVTLQFGTTAPINQYRYIRVGDKVHLIIDTITHILLQAPASLGDPALLPKHENITRLVLPDFTLNMDKDGNWQVKGQPSSNLSQDDLMAFVDDWRFAEALRISFFNNLTDKDRALPKVVINLKDNKTPLTFYLDTKSRDLTLTRTNPNIRYHLLKDKVNTLLNLPKPELPARTDDE